MFSPSHVTVLEDRKDDWLTPIPRSGQVTDWQLLYYRLLLRDRDNDCVARDAYLALPVPDRFAEPCHASVAVTPSDESALRANPY
jgi:hypothetical protein